MIRPPPRSNLPDTPFPYTTRFRSPASQAKRKERRLPPCPRRPPRGPAPPLHGRPLRSPPQPPPQGLLRTPRRQRQKENRRPHRRHAQDRHHPQRTGSRRSEEHTSELQSLMRISYAVFCLKKK